MPHTARAIIAGVNTQGYDNPGHIVLSGLDGIGFRTLEELVRLGERVVVIDDPTPSQFSGKAANLGVRIVLGDYRDEDTLQEAGIATALSFVVANDNDMGNLQAALAAHDINPGLRIVLRMFNVEFGSRLEALFHNGTVLSSSAIAAPAFVAAALLAHSEQQFEAAGQTLVVVQEPGDRHDTLLPLARPRGDGTTELFPASAQGALCLTRMEGSPRGGRAGLSRLTWFDRAARTLVGLWDAFMGADRRIRYVLMVLAVLAIVSTIIFYSFYNLSLSDAVYFTLTIMTTTGFGDISLRTAPLALKLYGVLLMLLGAASLTLFYALITDAIVSARLARALGSAHIHLHDHVIVCGLGTIGYRVVQRLAKLGVPVAAVEVDEDGRFVPTVRRLGVPVLIADARVPETLRALSIATARCIVVATDDDMTNLETALNARAFRPELRVVLRLFEPDLAARVERTFNMPISRSVSALAAPSFAAAAMGREVVATLGLGRVVLIAAYTRVDAGSRAEGATVSDLEDGVEGRVLFAGRGEGEKVARPSTDEVLCAGQELLVVATRHGLSQILDRVEQSGSPP